MNIKQKLGLGALVLGMSGCSGGYGYVSLPESLPELAVPEVPAIKNISTDVIASRPEEKYVVDTSDLSCVQANVTMGAWGYKIECDGERLLFKHSYYSGSDYLKSGGNYYIDDDLNGKVDLLYVDGVKAIVSDRIRDQYRVTLENLGKEKVQKLWEERW